MESTTPAALTATTITAVFILLLMDPTTITISAGLIFILIGLLIRAYTKSPTWADKVRYTTILILITAATHSVSFVCEEWMLAGLKTPASTYQLAITPLFVIPYFLYSSVFLAFATYRAGGIANLGNVDGDDLLSWLIRGFLVGLIVTLSIVIISTLSDDLSKGITIGLPIGLTIGLINALMNWLATGYKKEISQS